MTIAADAIVLDPFLRLEQVLAVFPVSPSSWYQGIKDGKYPAPLKIGPRASAWRTSDIKSLMDRCSDGALQHAA